MQVTDAWQCASSTVEAEQDKCGIDVKSVVIRDFDSQITMKKTKKTSRARLQSKFKMKAEGGFVIILSSADFSYNLGDKMRQKRLAREEGMRMTQRDRRDFAKQFQVV